MIRCSTCKEEKIESDFNRKRNGYQHFCKMCQKAYNHAHYLNDRQAYLARARTSKADNRIKLEELKSKPCTDCGGVFHPYAMEFDHLPGLGKTRDVARMMVISSWKKVLAEIAKCELVCANCHRVRTFKRLQEKGTTIRSVTSV